MKRKLFLIMTKAKAICAITAILVTLATAISALPPAHPQLDPSIHDIFQLNELGIMEKRGEIFVPRREPGAISYVEHWVLFENYVYPSAENRVVTIIRPSQRKLMTEEEFFARIPNRPGVRYVRVECSETVMLPGVSSAR